ncbi:MAG TPA: ArsC family reductase [Paucimonas sp.]|nr:ArsC family reductase [Paucimonas sp.]
MTTLYGIPNCDQVKKARAWLETNKIDYVFHDFKKAGIERGLIATWLRDVAWDVLVNRKGTTWRALPDERKAAIADDASATALMLEAPSVVKRPVLHVGGRTHVGFDEQRYREIFQR